MKKIIFNLILVILLLFIFSIQAFASTPKLVNKVNDAFKEIEEWILKISTPAAAVAICSGALMRKFSFGDEEKIRTGKKLITGSLFSKSGTFYDCIIIHLYCILCNTMFHENT